jgi:hypothetical protein
MPDPCSLRRTVALAATVVGTAGGPNAAAAQVIAPRTVPVQQSGQFDIFPSRLAGMAGVSITLDDTLLDPFVNPAKAVRANGLLVFGAPTIHTISRGGGRGGTVPVGLLGSHGKWAGGGLLAGQRLSHEPRGVPSSAEETNTNRYLSVLLARRLGRGFSVGASGYRADLDGMDGLDLLYAGSSRIAATGSQIDVRAGLVKEWANSRTLELLFLHGRSDMSHDVSFPVNSWDPATRTLRTVPRDEHNDDRLRFWGVHSEMTIPVDREGGRIGWLLTANRLTHPKIPNYPLANLPRDPGVTHAFDLGFGLGKALGGTSFGVDVVYEPIRSHTWADAASDIATEAGDVIPAGGKTVENWFRFQNRKIRIGFSRHVRIDADADTDSTATARIQLGFALNETSYRLHQRDHVTGAEREQSASWAEWGPTLGVGFRTRLFDVAYTLQMNCAPESCNIAQGDDVTVSPATPGTGVVVAPVGNGPGLGYGRTLVHHLIITLPRP